MSVQDDLTTISSDLETLKAVVDTAVTDLANSPTSEAPDPLLTAVKKAFTDAGWQPPEEIAAEESTETPS